MIDQAKNICIELMRNEKNPSVKGINDTIERVLKIFPNLASERETLFKYLSASFSVFSEEYHILDTEDGYTPWLKDAKANIQWNFWNRYVAYMKKKIAPDTLNKLDNLTDDILDRLSDPSTSGPWDKRGMVVGQVQSGKTSNYTGLINKAADAGYKLVIVLAGMHDSLRSQTQIRIDEGFLGFNSQHSLQYSNSNKIGVGFYNPVDYNSKMPIDMPANAFTSSSLDGDFRRSVAQTAGIHLKSSDPIVAVVKKNASILKNLITWLAAWGDKQANGKVIIRNVPLLLIDDEADNASINVSKEKVSTINGCIRALLSLFEQSAYIGYTATPFANIFIPILEQKTVKGIDLTIKNFEFTVGQDLFPKDFIINIPSPSNYIGPAKLFGLPAFTSYEMNEEPLPLLRLVRDYDVINGTEDSEMIYGNIAIVESDNPVNKVFVPNRHKKDDTLPDQLPYSLKYAIKCFILAAAARRVRKQLKVHNSMLVHVTRFIIWQDRIANLIDSELKFYQHQIEMKSGDLKNELRAIWERDFVPTTSIFVNDGVIYKDPGISSIQWDDIADEIYPAIAKMEVRAVHGDRNVAGLAHHNISPLDYFASEQQGKYLSVIAVGGDKLSRGLTLEGLTVSYYLRASKMYDTLMQMGRWFGYRPGYADLCRVFTSAELIGWYKHVTIASEEMRKDFDYMFLLNKTPGEFGLKVRTHPGVLKITAANKFRYGKTMYLSYSGQLEQTYQFTIDNNIFRNNFDAAIKFISALGKPLNNTLNTYNPTQKILWQGMDNYRTVTSFLWRYKSDEAVIDTNKIADYILAQAGKGNLVNWTVALINSSTADNEYFFPEISLKIGLIERTNTSADLTKYSIAKSNITDHRHEMIDLTEQEIENAREQTIADYLKMNKTEIPDIPSRKRIKWRRNSKNGLLLIYPLNPNCQHVINDRTEARKTVRKEIGNVPIIGIAISFPEIEGDEKIEYAVNEQFSNEYEYPEELDSTEVDNGTD